MSEFSLNFSAHCCQIKIDFSLHYTTKYFVSKNYSGFLFLFFSFNEIHKVAVCGENDDGVSDNFCSTLKIDVIR